MQYGEYENDLEIGIVSIFYACMRGRIRYAGSSIRRKRESIARRNDCYEQFSTFAYGN